MYWSDAGRDKIEYANLDGSSRTVLVNSADINQPVGLVYYQNQLFVVETSFSQLIVLNVTSETNSSVYAEGVVGVDGTFMQAYGILIFDPFHRETQGSVKFPISSFAFSESFKRLTVFCKTKQIFKAP